MKILVVYAHPSPESFCHAALERVLAGLARHDHDVELLDLYATGFDPVLGAAEWRDYMDDPEKTARGLLADHVGMIERAEGLVFVFPTWFFGQPAILKGWFDRVWLPGVAFSIPEDGGIARSCLRRIRFLGAVTTTGMPWLALQILGFPGQRVIKRCIRVGLAPRAEQIWMSLHKIETSTHARRVRFLDNIERRFARVR
jgi:putative NADPH-quinone reductase